MTAEAVEENYLPLRTVWSIDEMDGTSIDIGTARHGLVKLNRHAGE